MALRQEGWWTTKVPTVYWLPGLTYPTGLLTALLQTTARKNALAIDSLAWEYPVLPPYDKDAKLLAGGRVYSHDQSYTRLNSTLFQRRLSPTDS